MKKSIAMISICALIASVLAGCGETTKISSGAASEEASGSDSSQSGLSTSIDSTDDLNDEEGINHLSVINMPKYDSISTKDDTCSVYERYDELSLGEEDKEKYPELSSSIEELNSKMKDTSSASGDYVAQELQDCIDNGYQLMSDGNGYYAYYDTNVMRADENAVSLYSVIETYANWNHPSYEVVTNTYDTATGKELLLSDVVNDTSVLPELLQKLLLEKYDKDSFIVDNLEETIKDMMAEGTTPSDDTDYVTGESLEGTKTRGLSFVLGNNSLTIAFSPITIASSASGIQYVTLYFDEYPSLVKEKYMKAADDYVTPLVYDGEVYETTGENGTKVSPFSISSTIKDEDEGGPYETEFTLTIGDNSRTDTFYSYNMEYYYAFDNGRNFLYLVTHEESDYSAMYVYNLDAGDISNASNEPGQISLCPSDYCLIDPENMKLATRYDILGTYFGDMNYHIDTNGYPVTDDKAAIINWYDGMYVELLKDKSFKVCDTAGDGTNEDWYDEEIPKGTKLNLYRTDGSTFVDLKMDDGRIVRVDTVKKDYVVTIDGEAEEDVFDNIRYAG